MATVCENTVFSERLRTSVLENFWLWEDMMTKSLML